MDKEHQTTRKNSDKGNMKVSVIVSVYNEADILPITLPSLLNQDYPKEKTEIILVDDASTDETPQLLESSEWAESITVISHPENKGRAATRNSGIKVATGELLILLDCDIEVESYFISRHIEYYQNEKVIGVVSHIRTRDSKSKDKYHQYIFFGKRGASVIGENKPIPFKYFILGCSSIKTNAVKRTGLFNENLPTYGIDLEYAYRLWKIFPAGLFYSKTISVYMHNVKTLEEALASFRQYGQCNVPIILEEYPELAPYVAADLVKSTSGELTLKVIIGTILINPLVFQLTKRILKITPFPLSNILIRYLLAASAAMGYRKYLKNN